MSAEFLDMRLEDLIKKNRHLQIRGQGRGRSFGFRRGRGGFQAGRRGSGSNAVTRNSKGAAPFIGPSSYAIAKSFSRATVSFWHRDTLGNSMQALSSKFGYEAGVKLYVSNLDYGVSNSDIKQLFSEFGDLKRCTIHYDRSGRSKGTAEVVYARKDNALSVIRRYNGVNLDGRPMRIELVGMELPVTVSSSMRRGRGRGAPRSGPIWPRGRAYGFGRGQSWRQFHGRGRGRGRKSQVAEKSVEQLDRDLEQYHADAVETS